jgi:hypothetical protein
MSSQPQAQDRAEAKFKLVELSANDSMSWALWPLFESRVIAAEQSIATDTPSDHFIPQLRQWFAMGFTGAKFFAMINESDWTMHAHLVAYVERYYNHGYVLIHQLIADKGCRVTHLRYDLLKRMKAWADELNAAGASPPLDRIRWMSKRREWENYYVEAAVERYLFDLKLEDI